MGRSSSRSARSRLNFLLHYQHALRDTAPELWRYGLR